MSADTYICIKKFVVKITFIVLLNKTVVPFNQALSNIIEHRIKLVFPSIPSSCKYLVSQKAQENDQ